MTRNGNASAGTSEIAGRKKGTRQKPIALIGIARASPMRATMRGVAIAPSRPPTAESENTMPSMAGVRPSSRSTKIGSRVIAIVPEEVRDARRADDAPQQRVAEHPAQPLADLLQQRARGPRARGASRGPCVNSSATNDAT